MHDLGEDGEVWKYLLNLPKALKPEVSNESRIQDVSMAKYFKQAVCEKLARDKESRSNKPK